MSLLRSTLFRNFAALLLGALAFSLAPAARAEDKTALKPQPAVTVTDAPAAAELPDAPTPQPGLLADAVLPQDKQKKAPPPLDPHYSFFSGLSNSRYRTTISPGETVPHLTPGGKFIFALRETIMPGDLFVYVASAGVSHAEQTDPKYGSDSAGFGERIGAVALQGASINIISDGVLANVFHEDPRYYRDPEAGFGTRTWHAVSNVVIGQTDSGHKIFDFSGILGRVIAAGLTMTYYPRPSANVGVAAKTFGISLAGEAGGNLFVEFWPSIYAKMFHKD